MNVTAVKESALFWFLCLCRVLKKAISLLKKPGDRHILELQWAKTNLKFSWIFSDLTQILRMEERGYNLEKTRNLYSEKKYFPKKYFTLHKGEYLI
jgi:hypothetical protein